MESEPYRERPLEDPSNLLPRKPRRRAQQEYPKVRRHGRIDPWISFCNLRDRDHKRDEECDCKQQPRPSSTNDKRDNKIEAQLDNNGPKDTAGEKRQCVRPVFETWR